MGRVRATPTHLTFQISLFIQILTVVLPGGTVDAQTTCTDTPGAGCTGLVNLWSVTSCHIQTPDPVTMRVT